MDIKPDGQTVEFADTKKHSPTNIGARANNTLQIHMC